MEKEDFPIFVCKRCGYEWRSRMRKKRPAQCPRCHSVAWDREREEK